MDQKQDVTQVASSKPKTQSLSYSKVLVLITVSAFLFGVMSMLLIYGYTQRNVKANNQAALKQSETISSSSSTITEMQKANDSEDIEADSNIYVNPDISELRFSRSFADEIHVTTISDTSYIDRAKYIDLLWKNTQSRLRIQYEGSGYFADIMPQAIFLHKGSPSISDEDLIESNSFKQIDKNLFRIKLNKKQMESYVQDNSLKNHYVYLASKFVQRSDKKFQNFIESCKKDPNTVFSAMEGDAGILTSRCDLILNQNISGYLSSTLFYNNFRADPDDIFGSYLGIVTYVSNNEPSKEIDEFVKKLPMIFNE